ncbi:DUF3472 domain-containing protein [Streptacidiphilus jiangxiensis]|uniref:Ricin-type beta-trefoil lectin domain-containing protein n=1 Tax=Streptacidiphilus jiangxiensis TaxID=235985 RepID=A0A1H7TRC7_STRJI|nr:DUF3472 domain-containing protein [Streptacidiphilus jiangxiensis]SEL87341.1 Ricin-type beta-trefoil lectin domain-containing protein [Streptacidiphilus jiangxiensis]
MTYRRVRPRLLGGLLSLGVVAGLGLAVAPGAHADDGHTPGSSTDYAFPAGTRPLHDVTWTTTPTVDPGWTADVFWSHQFDLDDGRTGSIGLRSNGGDPRWMLFSVRNATQAVPGAGSHCESFGGEGTGEHCAATVDWTTGHTYAFTVSAVGDGWFEGKVTDQQTRRTIVLGRIRTTAHAVSTQNMVDRTEYVEWNDPRSTCYDQPGSGVRFGLPSGDGGRVHAGVSGTGLGPACDPQSRVARVAGGSVQRNGIGNSVRGEVGKGKACLGVHGTVADGVVAALVPCLPRADRGWVHGSDGTLRLPSNYCLGDGRTGVRIRDCKGAKDSGRVTDPAKLWTYDPARGELRNRQTGRCLAADGSGLASRRCSADPSDRGWTLPTLDGRTPRTPQAGALSASAVSLDPTGLLARTGVDGRVLATALASVGLVAAGSTVVLLVRRRRRDAR